jgi:putative Holliday junction resolvase
MKYLGIDFGTKNIGLAVSDRDGHMAFPYLQMKNSNKIIEDLGKILIKEGVGHIVLGYSIDSTGKENSVMEHVHIFKKKLEEKILIPVSFQKEFMTSVLARQSFTGKTTFHARQVKKVKSDKDDVSAAILILQRYLDGINNSK